MVIAATHQELPLANVKQLRIERPVFVNPEAFLSVRDI